MSTPSEDPEDARAVLEYLEAKWITEDPVRAEEILAGINARRAAKEPTE